MINEDNYYIYGLVVIGRSHIYDCKQYKWNQIYLAKYQHIFN